MENRQRLKKGWIHAGWTDDACVTPIVALNSQQVQCLESAWRAALQHHDPDYRPLPGIPSRTFVFPNGYQLLYRGSMGDDIGIATTSTWSRKVIDILAKIEKEWNERMFNAIVSAIGVKQDRVKPCGDCVHCLGISQESFGTMMTCALGYSVFNPLNGGRDFITETDLALARSPDEDGRCMREGQRFLCSDDFQIFWSKKINLPDASRHLPCSHTGCDRELCELLDNEYFATQQYLDRAKYLRDPRRGRCPKWYLRACHGSRVPV